MWVLLVITDQKVGGLDVLVNNLAIVGILEGARCLEHQLGYIERRKQPGFPVITKPAGQGTFLAQRHDHIGDDRTMNSRLTVVIQRKNMRVIEGGNRFDLALEKT